MHGQINYKSIINLKPTMIGQDVRFNRIKNLLPQTHKIRNVSIVAHVDHGKTTLADCLIASNGIIHKKQAGHLKLLDDRADQQNRGITMKSSSICLSYNDHLINLIDSPGHLQFHCEVSAALRLTDSALLVVDAVEGVSSQTFRVLNQLYNEKLPSILIVNKIDKLITHCKMDPMQAYNQINQIIEQVNAILGSFIAKEVGVGKQRARSKSQDLSQENLEKLEGMFYFSHTKKNIIFGSALDNWGFAVENFSGLLSKKIGLPAEEINKYLWGDYYFYPKKKQFKDKPKNQNDRPLCVDFILKPIWDIFESIQNQERDKINNIITKLNLKVTENAKKAFNANLVREMLNSWLPLDKIVLARIVEILPDPIQAQKFRLPYLTSMNNFSEKPSKQIDKALSECSHDQKQPLIVFISKMVNIPKGNFNQHGLKGLQSTGSTHTLGFGRIFSGKFRRGQKIYLIGAKKKKIHDQEGNLIKLVPDLTELVVENLYIFNAQYPDGIQEAYAGNIVGIGGLQQHMFKSGTISTSPDCLSFIPVASNSKSILKVSVSTPDIQDNQKMLQGLKKLNKSDPSVEVFYQTNGNIVLSTCGQVHLQKCLVDLEEIYCSVPIKFSEPIINFKETIVWTTLSQNKNQKYIEEITRKKEQKLKKEKMEKLKEQMKIGAELDDDEKQKLKAMKQWDHHVQIYSSDDLTVEDTRFFFKSWYEEEEQKFAYKDEKIIKKTDHKNKGKLHMKQKFLNLNLKTNVNSQLTPNQFLKITIKALGMNFQFAQFLEKSSQDIREIFVENLDKKGEGKLDRKERILQFMDLMQEKMKQFEIESNVQELIMNNIINFGPNGYGPNIFCIPGIENRFTLFQRTLHKQGFLAEALKVDEKVMQLFDQYKTSTTEILNSIISGFGIACQSGPLCNQPLMGVIFILQNIERVEPPKEETQNKESEMIEQQEIKQKMEEKQEKIEEISEQKFVERIFTDSFGPLSGQVMSTVKDACIEAFLGGSPRLVEPMYLCQLQTDQQYYGHIHMELSKRRAKILEEDLHEFSNVFIIKALLPIIQSFKFCFEMLDKTQGTVNAQLDFSTWKIYTEDPFYTPLTEQEIEDMGLQSVGHNSARVLLDKIREKKGLRTTQKIVTAAQKQRTLKKN